MAKAGMEFDKYGKVRAEFQPEEAHKPIPQFNDIAGGGASVDPFGSDMGSGRKITPNMNAAQSFHEKDLSKIDAMGTDAPKGSNKGQMSDNKGDHFKLSVENDAIDPFGTDAGKKKSGHSDRR